MAFAAACPILRDGVLSRDEVAEAVTAYLPNDLDLFEESLPLCSHEKVAAGGGARGLKARRLIAGRIEVIGGVAYRAMISRAVASVKSERR